MDTLNISPAGSLNTTEWRRNLRDIVLFGLSFTPQLIQHLQGMDWGAYSPVVTFVTGTVLVILNRYFNVVRVKDATATADTTPTPSLDTPPTVDNPAT